MALIMSYAKNQNENISPSTDLPLLNFNNWISIRVEWIFGYLLKEVEKYFNHLFYGNETFPFVRCTCTYVFDRCCISK